MSQIQFSTSPENIDPLAGANSTPDDFDGGEPGTPTPTAIPRVPPGFMDPNGEINDPFALDDESEDRILRLPEPQYTWAENEKNLLYREFFVEAERDSKAIHRRLMFWKPNELARGDLASYSDADAKRIIETTEALNDEQRAAVLHCDEALILHALAGTGKTRTLSACISYLLARGVFPPSIAVSSHTVTAAQEIKNRVEPMIAELFPAVNENRMEGGMGRIHAGTIHALAYRELGKHHHPRSRHTIIEESNQTKLWKEACQFAMGPDYTSDDDNLLIEWMRLHERIRGMAIPESRISQVLKAITKSDRLPKIAETYFKIKEARELLDYTDLLRLWIPLLIHPGYRQKWEFFFVDEYQDTSPLQKFILKILRHQGTNVIVCGDIRQSITSFTGSDPAIDDPLEMLPGPTPARQLWLQTNYRCTREILSLANGILKKMYPPEKHRLSAWDDAEDGAPIKLSQVYNKNDDCRTTINEATELLTELASPDPEAKAPSIAILYRTNAQGGKLEETIAELNSRRTKKGEPPITYVRKDYRRTALRNRTEKEIGAILHALCSPAKARWYEIFTSPYFPGIGEVTANTIASKTIKRAPTSVEEVWDTLEGEIPRRGLENVGNFLSMWEEIAKGLPQGDLSQLRCNAAVNAVRKWIKIGLEILPQGKEKEDGSPLSKREIEESQRRSYEASYLERVERHKDDLLQETLKKLEEDARKEEQAEGSSAQENASGIILSTIHLSKGKEYDGVVVHNVTWGSLPHYNATQQEEILDSALERRWRKFCALEAEKMSEEEGLLDEVLSDPREQLPTIVGFPKEGLWGRTLAQTPVDFEEEDAKAPNHTVAWDWMTNPIEEEKRLLYVAVTRARRQLVITHRCDRSHPFIPANQWWKMDQGQSLL